MSFTSGLVVFVIVWWLVLFTVLPWGIRREENPEAGHEPGAPANPRLWLKAGITTLVACIIWGVIYWAIDADLIHFGPR
jgi:predicted secreted protein